MNELEEYKTLYINLSLPEKREFVLGILSLLLGHGENFDVIYQYMIEKPENITELHYNEVFEIILWGLYVDSQEKEKKTQILLLEIREKLMNIRSEEQIDHEREKGSNSIETQFSVT